MKMGALRIDTFRPVVHIVDSDFTSKTTGAHTHWYKANVLQWAGKRHQGTGFLMSHAQRSGTARVSCCCATLLQVFAWLQ